MAIWKIQAFIMRIVDFFVTIIGFVLGKIWGIFKLFFTMINWYWVLYALIVAAINTFDIGKGNILISTFKLGIYANFAAIPMQLIFENLLEFLFF